MTSRKAQIAAFVKDVNKQLKRSKGQGRIDLGSDIQFIDPPRIRTGILGLDILTYGGIPRQHMTQFWGAYSTGKTTTALHCAKMVQKDEGSVAFAAAEGFNKRWGRKNGLLIPFTEEELQDMADDGREDEAEQFEEEQEGWPPFVTLQHAHGDGLLEMVVQTIKSNLFDIVIVDSLAAIKRYRNIEERGMEDETRGGEAAMYAQFCGKVFSAMNTRYDPETMAPTGDDNWVPNSTAVVVLNQARINFGYNKGGRAAFQATGGEALKHAWGCSIQFSPGPRFSEKRGDTKVYHSQEMRAFCEKSKIGPPFRDADWRFYFEHHGGFEPGQIDTAREVFTWATFYGLIDRSGAWYSYEGERLGQGGENAIEALRQDDDLLDGLYEECLIQSRKD